MVVYTVVCVDMECAGAELLGRQGGREGGTYSRSDCLAAQQASDSFHLTERVTAITSHSTLQGCCNTFYPPSPR